MTDKTPKAIKKSTPKGDSVVRKIKTDWEAIERDYRTGKYTLRELATKHGPSHQAIAKQAKKNGWTQDLSAAIRQATNAKLVDELVNQEVAKGGQAVANTILAAAEIGKNVIMGHRKGLAELTDVKQLLLNQIKSAAENMPDLAAVIEMVRCPDDNGMDRANDALRKAMGRSALVDDLKKLADVDEKVRKGEREAFDLNTTPPDKDKEDKDETQRKADSYALFNARLIKLGLE